MLMRIIGAAATSVCIATGSFGQTGAIDQAKQIPAYSLPIPEDISPKMRALVGGAACAVGHSPEKHCRTETARRQSGGSGKKTILPAMRENAPEMKEAFEEIAHFFDGHMAR
jgi:hypothetical protein